MDIIQKIVFHKEFSAREYFQEEAKKTQVVLHHTVSPEGVGGDINWWMKDPRRVATCLIIANDGTPHQVFSSKFWAYHLGLDNDDFKRVGLKYKDLNKCTIGIEIDSNGGLKWDKASGVWRSTYGRVVPRDKVQEYPEGYRGFKAFERYTDEQIETVRELLLYFHDKYGIPLDYHAGMFDVSKEALTGVPGIWSHVSYRWDKSDCHPQPELIEMLKNLKP